MGMFLYAFEDGNMYAFFIAFDSTEIERAFRRFYVNKEATVDEKVAFTKGGILQFSRLAEATHGNHSREITSKYDIMLLCCLGMQRGEMIVVNRLLRPRKIHG